MLDTFGATHLPGRAIHVRVLPRQPSGRRVAARSAPADLGGRAPVNDDGPPLLRQFGVKIHSFYGASESGGISYDASDDGR